MGRSSGKNGSQSKSSSSNTQSKLNAALKASGGKWTKEVNDLAKQRDREKGQVYNTKTKTYSSTGGGKSNDNSSGGIKSLGTALKNAPKNIARDIGMGVGLTKRDADYYRRTANTIARTQGKAAADRYISQMTQKGGLAAAGVKNADVSGSVDYGQRIGMLNADGSVNTKYMSSDDGGGGAVTNTAIPEGDMSSIYDENRRRYEEFMQSQQPQQPQVTPEMRREALNIFESQQGAGQVPYYMAAARRPQFMPMIPGEDIYYRQVGAVQPQFPENRMPGYGGQGVQPNQDQPSAARARELIMAGDVEAGMRMLKASAGMEDTSLKSADALQYMQKTGDQAGTEQILKSSVGLPSMATGLGQRQVGRQINRDPFGMPIVGSPRNFPMQQNPNMSPAFQYAAQNYETLGGSQRLAPRPMEMMSVAERGQINDMAQAMADEQARKQAEEAEYRRGMDMVMRGGGKGGPRTSPQLPPGMVGLPRDPYMPRFGGKGGGGVAPQIPPMGQPVPFNPYVVAGGQRSPFASILASRFGGFGG